MLINQQSSIHSILSISKTKKFALSFPILVGRIQTRKGEPFEQEQAYSDSIRLILIPLSTNWSLLTIIMTYWLSNITTAIFDLQVSFHMFIHSNWCIFSKKMMLWKMTTIIMEISFDKYGMILVPKEIILWYLYL